MVDLLTTIKQHIVDDRSRIELHDAISTETRRVIGVFSGDQFLASSPLSDKAFRQRIAAYVLTSVLAVPLMTRKREHEAAVVASVGGLSNVETAYKVLDGLEQMQVPRSEHIFGLLQLGLEKLIFWGSSYERSFDRFEVLYALEYAHRTDNGRPPMGRFDWKSSDRESSPLHQVIAEAEAAKQAWPPLAAGLCGGFGLISQHVVESVARRRRF